MQGQRDVNATSTRRQRNGNATSTQRQPSTHLVSVQALDALGRSHFVCVPGVHVRARARTRGAGGGGGGGGGGVGEGERHGEQQQVERDPGHRRQRFLPGMDTKYFSLSIFSLAKYLH